MALFPTSGVLRGVAPAACEEAVCGVLNVRLNTNPCACPVKCEAYLTGAALLIEKITHF